MLGIRFWRPAPQKRRMQASVEPQKRWCAPFHLPMRRPIRPTTTDGRTSFHFSHVSISKVLEPKEADGLRIRPGSAAAHGEYIERDTAVAQAAPNIGEGITNGLAPSRSAEAEHVDFATAHKQSKKENDDVQRFQEAARAALERIEFRFPGFDFFGSDHRDSGADADMCPMPGGMVGAERWRPERLVPDDAFLGSSTGRWGAGSLSGPGLRDPRGTESEKAGLKHQNASDHDAYVARESAVAVQPDGARVLFTNIDPDPVKRAEFWSLVEQEEAKPSPDKMTVHRERSPEFWARVFESPDCPEPLKNALSSTDKSRTNRFEIESGEAMRGWLERQPGWVKIRKQKDGETDASFRAFKRTLLATFHDGRGGRIQDRIIGELPHELPHPGRVRLLRRFAADFERRGLPFVAVMHAPDHANNQKNWHFHLIYYDRPCRRITDADIAWAREDGFDVTPLSAGQWDFAARPIKKGKRQVPFKQLKVREVSGLSWIPKLRRRFAWLANEELKRAEIDRRYDPRTYATMGIEVLPGEKLDPGLSRKESLGEATDKGTRNEARQWQAIEAQIDKKLASDHARVGEEFKPLRHRVAGLPASDEANKFGRRIDQAEEAARIANERDAEAERTHQLIARLASRSTQLKEINDSWLEADLRGDCQLSDRERTRRTVLSDDAHAYLSAMAPFLAEGQAVVDGCRKDAEQKRVASRTAVLFLHGELDDHEMEVESARLQVADPARTVVPVASMPTAPAQPNGDAVDQFIARLDKTRPRIEKLENGYRIADRTFARHLPASDPRIQQAIAARYTAQEEEAVAVAGWVDRNRRSFVRQKNGWEYAGVDRPGRAEFMRLREHPKVRQAIERMVNPSAAARRVASPASAGSGRPLPEPTSAKAALTVPLHEPGPPPPPLATPERRAPSASSADHSGSAPINAACSVSRSVGGEQQPGNDGPVPRTAPDTGSGRATAKARTASAEVIAKLAETLAGLNKPKKTKRAGTPVPSQPDPTEREMQSAQARLPQDSYGSHQPVEPRIGDRPSEPNPSASSAKKPAPKLVALNPDDEMRRQAKIQAEADRRRRAALESEIEAEEKAEEGQKKSTSPTQSDEAKQDNAAKKAALEAWRRGRGM
ncbi:MobA/MobL family protein [Stakelama pacifica]|uniref:MobA/MobL family protein n=2 Tax=Stakelama pacifica TaxID=517720 RepID=A0A4R6F9X9_9SPHN|nr:MobA/MobL family protein [Stakelama pacifica]